MIHTQVIYQQYDRWSDVLRSLFCFILYLYYEISTFQLEIIYTFYNETQLKIILFHNSLWGLKLILELQKQMETGMEELLNVSDIVSLFRRTARNFTKSSGGEL